MKRSSKAWRASLVRDGGGAAAANLGRLSVRSRRGVFFNGHAEFVKLAIVLRVLGSDALGNGLGALELRAGIEEAALLAAVQFKLALGTFAVGVEAGSQDRAAIGAAARVTVPTMRGVRGPN